MTEKQYIVSESRLKYLLETEARMIVLEQDGVDNWEWYMEGAKDFLKEENCETFEELAENKLARYNWIV